jgi:hypothetical protein
MAMSVARTTRDVTKGSKPDCKTNQRTATTCAELGMMNKVLRVLVMVSLMNGTSPVVLSPILEISS